MKLNAIFFALTIGDLITTVVGLDLGLQEAGRTATLIPQLGTIGYAAFRITGGLLVLGGIGAIKHLGRNYWDIQMLAKGLLVLLTLPLAGVVVNNLWLIASIQGL